MIFTIVYVEKGGIKKPSSLLEDLILQVNEKLQEGWMLQGGVCSDNSSGYFLCQALVRKEEKEEV